nr:LysM peptidoglycan-binding domain-containing protein [uncultured Mediterraneibacter sp.]
MKKKRNRRSTGKRLRNLFFGMISAILICSLSFGVFLVSAHENTPDPDASYTYYTSIEIRPGDTLWAIAEENLTDDYDSVSEYVRVLKEINQLDSDEIHSGQNLIIAYSDTAFK